MPRKHSGSLCLPDAWTLRGSAFSPLEVRGDGVVSRAPGFPRASLRASAPPPLVLSCPANSGCRGLVAGAGGARPQGLPGLSWPS